MPFYKKNHRAPGIPKFSGMQARELVVGLESPLWTALYDREQAEEELIGLLEIEETVGWELLASDDAYARYIGETIIRLIYPPAIPEAS